MKQHLLNAWVVALLSTVGVAQATITVPDVATAGQDVTIRYTNPNAAGQTITVTIDDGGFPTPTVVTVDIQLDANGEGAVKWTVPNWVQAKFNAMGAQEEIMLIEQPPTACRGLRLRATASAAQAAASSAPAAATAAVPATPAAAPGAPGAPGRAAAATRRQ